MHAPMIGERRKTDRVVDTPDGVKSQALYSASGSVDRVELDTENESHLGVVGLDVDTIADGTEDAGCDLDGLSDFDKVDIGELEGGMVGVGLNGDRYLDLAFKLVELSCVLRLGQGELVAGDPVDDEAVLGEDVLGFGGLAEVIIAEVNATSVDRYAA
jgi:hypothetical protein